MCIGTHLLSSCRRVCLICCSPGGVIEHDLSKVDFEVVDDENMLNDPEDDEVVEPVAKPGPLSPRRKWFLEQETKEQAASEPVEADGAAAAAAPVNAQQWRGRAAMRRVRQTAAGLLSSPIKRSTRRAAASTSTTMTYRI